jgi:hypothetical protein
MDPYLHSIDTPHNKNDKHTLITKTWFGLQMEH